ncbi:hypothetical protein ELH42_37760 [Rhizobium ruizarguesonis]|uniref:hypothetical protein n=1 Tax=Rhizobium ruizarguesonis TaxID=2081791 RepID=UPI00103164C8|nr:hypothetical protein [Rhizobium ruizarguesonis]TBB57026.1 hypothetical protein ELH42_37760 [Rhizobium ruizarguesonis]
MPNKKTPNTNKEPQRSPTPATEIPPPSLHRQSVLPLVAVGSVKFEELCRDVLKLGFPDIRRAALKRTSGVSQFGVDVEGFDRLGYPEVVVSAKCYKRIDAWEFRPWLQDFIDHLDGHWKDKRVKHFILAVSVDTNDDSMNENARDLAASLDERGIEFHLWDTSFITDLLRNDPGLVDRYFNRFWTEAISADGAKENPTVEPTAPVSLKNMTGSLAAMIAELQQAYLGPLNSSIANELESAVRELRRGRRSPIRKWLENNQGDEPVWNALEPQTRARGLRVVAIIELAEGNFERASILLDEADQLFEDTDRNARILFVRATKGADEALEILGEPNGRREHELAAGLLIEIGRPKAALDILAPFIGDEVSSEVLRLRAIAEVLSGGDRRAALNLTKSALAREPNSAIARLTKATVHVACSVVNGVVPTFGNAPGPISSSLVRSNPDAIEHLKLARADFDHLHGVVEGDIKIEVEVWKLATLLLDPDMKREARSYARSLLSRPDPDPLVVAWCQQYGLPMRRGKIKKLLGDSLRRGHGTPSHVIVLAMMTSAFANPVSAISVIDKFSGDFPEITKPFFQDWRHQFGADAGRPEESYSAGVRHAIETRDARPLKAFLLSERATLEAVLAGAEFMVSRGYLSEVNELRQALMAIGTARAVELAAFAALRSNDPRACVALLETAQTNGIELPDRLIRLRVSAREILGEHQDLIGDLKRLLELDDDDRVRSRLFDAYLKIGALEEAKVETEKALAAGKLGPHDAVRLATALRTIAPGTARELLADAAKSDIPKELAGTVLSLSAELGLAELQDEMLRKVLAGPQPESVKRFDSVEEVIAQLKHRADAHRETIGEWLHGRLPAVAALAGDSKDYALLFLGDILARRTSTGEAFPMLLDAGTERPSRPPLTQARQQLQIDLGALLLADRLGIVEMLDRAFSIQLPKSLPEALVEMEGKFGEVSRPIANGIRAIEKRDSAIQVAEAPSQDSFLLVYLRDAQDNDEQLDVMEMLLSNAYKNGHMTLTQLSGARVSLDLGGERGPPSRPIGKVLVSGSALFDLLRLDLLEPLARSSPLYVLESDLHRHLLQIEIAEAEEKIGTSISHLRKLVAERLASSRWRTIGSGVEDQGDGGKHHAAHVRCLIEVLPTEESDSALIWIEDRTLSKRPYNSVLGLGGILATLRDAGELDFTRYSQIMRSLRDAGYSFLPIDIDEIVAIIRQAAVVNNRVVENEDLSSLRRWISRDVINLRFLDPTVEIDADGRPSGESRRMLQLSQLSSDLVMRIWHGCPDTDDAAARSAWVWANLRVDYLPSPPASADPTSRRHLAVMNIVHALFEPVQSDLGREKFPEDRRAPYVNWLMENAFAPAVESDPEVGDILVSVLSSLIERLTSEPQEIDQDVAKALGNKMRRVIGQFLGLLPLDLADRIGEQHHIDDFLGRETIMLLEVGDDWRVAVRDIEGAFAAALNNTDRMARVPLYKDRKTAELRLSTVDELPRAILKIGKRELPFDTATIAALHPDAEIRQRLLNSVSASANRRFSEGEILKISNEGSTERRVEMLHELNATDFSRKIAQLRQKIANGGLLDANDLKLPEPSALLEFLGLPSDFRGAAGDVAEQAAAALGSQLGIDDLCDRLSSLPTEMPETVARAIRDFGADGRLSRMPWLFAVAGSFVLAKQGSLKGEHLEILDRMTQPRLRLFSALLDGSGRQAVRRESWRALDPELAFLLIWLHSGQLMRVLDVPNMPLGDLTSWVKARTRRKLTDTDEELVWKGWVAHSLFGISPNRLRAAIIGELLRLGVDMPDSLASLVGLGEGDGWSPQPDLLCEVPEAPAWCWVGIDPVLQFQARGWMSPDNPFSIRDGSELLLRMISEMNEDNWRAMMTFAALVTDIAVVAEEAIIKLVGRIEEFATPMEIAEDDPSRGALLDVVSRVYGRLRREEDFMRLVEAVARHGNRKWPVHRDDKGTNKGAYGLAIELINGVYLYEWTRGVPVVERLQGLSGTIKRLVDAWPAMLAVGTESLEGTAEQFDVATASSGVWPVLLELRSR